MLLHMSHNYIAKLWHKSPFGTTAAPFQKNASSEPVPSVIIALQSRYGLYDPFDQLSRCLSWLLVPHTRSWTPAKQPRHTIVTSAVWVDSKGTVQRIWRTMYQASKDLGTSEVLGQWSPTKRQSTILGYARMFCQWICLLAPLRVKFCRGEDVVPQHPNSSMCGESRSVQHFRKARCLWTRNQNAT